MNNLPLLDHFVVGGWPRHDPHISQLHDQIKISLACIQSSLRLLAEIEPSNSSRLTSKSLTNPKYWRDRAEAMQAIADRLVNQETKRTMQDIAVCCEQLAQRAEERLSASRPGS